MPLDPYLAKALLDWSLGGATPTRPTSLFVMPAMSSPTTQSSFDGSFFTRRIGSMSFNAAASPAGSCSLASTALTQATATAAASPVGWNMYDAPTGGNRLMFGTFTAAVGCKSGDSIQILVTGGQLTIVLN